MTGHRHPCLTCCTHHLRIFKGSNLCEVATGCLELAARCKAVSAGRKAASPLTTACLSQSVGLGYSFAALT